MDLGIGFAEKTLSFVFEERKGGGESVVSLLVIGKGEEEERKYPGFN